MTITLIIIVLAFYYLLIETRFLTIRLLAGKYPATIMGLIMYVVSQIVVRNIITGKKITGNIIVKELSPIVAALCVLVNLRVLANLQK